MLAEKHELVPKKARTIPEEFTEIDWHMRN
jgi:hypothetical protein